MARRSLRNGPIAIIRAYVALSKHPEPNVWAFLEQTTSKMLYVNVYLHIVLPTSFVGFPWQFQSRVA